MSLKISPATGIRLTDADGHLVFDTGTEKMFYLRPVDYITGTLTTSTYNTGQTVGVDHVLGTVHASAVFVRGAMAITAYPSTGLQMQGFPVNRYFNVSGTYVHVFTSLVMHTFSPIVVGTDLILREKLISKLQQNAGGQTYQLGGVTIAYKMICGQFT